MGTALSSTAPGTALPVLRDSGNLRGLVELPAAQVPGARRLPVGPLPKPALCTDPRRRLPAPALPVSPAHLGPQCANPGRQPGRSASAALSVRACQIERTCGSNASSGPSLSIT